jgi:hypothetical protein
MSIVVVIYSLFAVLTFLGLQGIKLELGAAGGVIWFALGYRPVEKVQEHRKKARDLEAILPAVAVQQQEQLKDSLLKLIETTITISID